MNQNFIYNTHNILYKNKALFILNVLKKCNEKISFSLIIYHNSLKKSFEPFSVDASLQCHWKLKIFDFPIVISVFVPKYHDLRS